MGVFNKAVGNMPKGKDTTPTLDAQVVDLPVSDENEKQIMIQRPDTDADKNVNLPATSSGGALVPPEPPQFDTSALAQPNSEIAPAGNRDVAEDVEFTVDKTEPEGIEGYKQAGESWVEPSQEDNAGDNDNEDNDDNADDDDNKDDSEGDNDNEDNKDNDKDLKSPEKKSDKKKKNTKKKGDNGLKDLLNSGASGFSINDIVESETEVPHYQYRSLLNRR